MYRVQLTLAIHRRWGPDSAGCVERSPYVAELCTRSSRACRAEGRLLVEQSRSYNRSFVATDLLLCSYLTTRLVLYTNSCNCPKIAACSTPPDESTCWLSAGFSRLACVLAYHIMEAHCFAAVWLLHFWGSSSCWWPLREEGHGRYKSSTFCEATSLRWAEGAHDSSFDDAIY